MSKLSKVYIYKTEGYQTNCWVAFKYNVFTQYFDNWQEAMDYALWRCGLGPCK